jgi:hypothetical protein
LVQVIASPNSPALRNPQYVECSYTPGKLNMLSIARNGALAMALVDSVSDHPRRIIVIHADGSRTTMSLPPTEMLTQNFRNYERRNGKPVFQDVFFKNVQLAEDGTPFATVESHFSGAFSGSESAVFRWDGTAWHQVPPYQAMSHWRGAATMVNTEIAAADTPDTVAFNALYGRRAIPDLGRAEDPQYLLDQTGLLINNRITPLGIGTATAMHGTTVVGFRGGLNVFRSPDCVHQRMTVAMAWTNGQPTTLGRGVAYGVNVHKQMVGDNEETLGGIGRPVLWSGGHTFELDSRIGSAFAISDDGVIVGQVDNSAFLADAHHPSDAVVLLDRQIRDHGWHIIAAYGISASGRILAVGTRRGASAQVLVLNPIASTR